MDAELFYMNIIHSIEIDLLESGREKSKTITMNSSATTYYT